MRTSGGRGVGAVLALVAPALLLSTAVAGCAGDADRAHVLQTHLGRIDQVEQAHFTAPTRDRGAVIDVTFDPDGVASAPKLVGLIAEIDAAAREQDYETYRLDLAAEGDDSSLVLDDTFAGSPAEERTLANWYAVRETLIGDVRSVVEPGAETITVESGGGIAHDVGEASRIDYGGPGTTWIFVNGDTSFTVSGSVGSRDVSLFQDVQRSVSSESLPAAAPGWRLDRRDGHVRLDLDVSFDGQPVAPADLTVAHYGTEVAPLAHAALGAVGVLDLPVWLDLRNDDGADDFASWTSEQAPAKGRDPLDRGWDAWLADLAEARSHSTGG